MADLKIITHTTYTYETTDGREFESKQEAESWQKSIDTSERIIMLDSRYRPTTEIDTVYFVYIKDREQLEAFNAIQEEQGIETLIEEPGYFYYDERVDEYINVDTEIKRLLNIKTKLDSATITL